jgi:hypothetical protein
VIRAPAPGVKPGDEKLVVNPLKTGSRPRCIRDCLLEAYALTVKSFAYSTENTQPPPALRTHKSDFLPPRESIGSHTRRATTVYIALAPNALITGACTPTEPR